MEQPLRFRRRAGPFVTEDQRRAAKRARQRRWWAAHAAELRASDKARYNPEARAARYAANREQELSKRRVRYYRQKEAAAAPPPPVVPRPPETEEERLTRICEPTIYAELEFER